MAYPRKRKPANTSAAVAADIARDFSSGTRFGALTPTPSFENSRNSAKYYRGLSKETRSYNGSFRRKADRNRDAYIARQISHNSAARGNDYQYGTREEVAAQHNARYRNIRRAFGMSAG